jgi:hypothetical protein
MISHRCYRMGWISSIAPGGEESAGPGRGSLLWLNHRVTEVTRLSVPNGGGGAQSIVGHNSLGGILT